MLSGFDNLTTTLTCPKCSKETPKELKWLKDNTEFTCDCGNVTVFDNNKIIDIPSLSEYLKEKGFK